MSGTFGDANLRNEVVAISAGLDTRINAIVALDNNQANQIAALSGNSISQSSQITQISGNIISVGSQISAISGANISQASQINTISGNSISLSSQITNLSASVLVLEDVKNKVSEPRGFENRNTSLNFDSSSRLFAISGNYSIWNSGIKYSKTGENYIIPNTTNPYFFYYNNAGVFTVTTSAWSILADVPIALVYYNSTDAKGILLEERHGIIMDSITHNYLHSTRGTQLESLGSLSGLNIQESNPSITGQQWVLGQTTIWDEDLKSVLPQSTKGSYYSVYRSGVTGEWRISTGLTLPYLVGGTSYIAYNQNNAGTWQSTELDNVNNYCNYYIAAVPSISGQYNYVLVPGQASYTSLASAQNETTANLSLTGFPFAEVVFIYRITYLYGNTYTATNRTRVEAVASINNNIITTTSTTNISHNTLSGLQGGTTNEYFHLTSAQITGYIDRTEVASISAGLDTRITATVSLDANQASQIAALSGQNISQASQIASISANYATTIVSASMSANALAQATGLININTSVDTNQATQIAALSGNSISVGSQVATLSAADINQAIQIAQLSGANISQTSQISSISANSVSFSVCSAMSANALAQATGLININSSLDANQATQIAQLSGVNISQASQIASISANYTTTILAASMSANALAQANGITAGITGNFVKKSGDTMSGTLVVQGAVATEINPAIKVPYRQLIHFNDSTTNITSGGYIWLTDNNTMGFGVNNDTRMTMTPGGLYWIGNPFWHSGNDGASSGLDADLLDGQHGSYYISISDAMSANALTQVTNTFVNKNGSSTMTGNLQLGTSVDVGTSYSVYSSSYGNLIRSNAMGYGHISNSYPALQIGVPTKNIALGVDVSTVSGGGFGGNGGEVMLNRNITFMQPNVVNNDWERATITVGTAKAYNGFQVVGQAGLDGSMEKNPVYGLTMQGVAGSAGEFSIVTPSAGAVVAYVPTGTSVMKFVHGLNVVGGTTAMEALTATTATINSITITGALSSPVTTQLIAITGSLQNQINNGVSLAVCSSMSANALAQATTLINVNTALDANQATQIAQISGNYVKKSGDTMSGNLTLSTGILNVNTGLTTVQALTTNGTTTINGNLNVSKVDVSNQGFGYNSLLSVTSGLYNTAVGTYALSAVQTATENTAIGYGALQNGIGVQYSTAVGALALNSATDGYINTALGCRAMMLTTTGYENTAVGKSAMESNTTGYCNVAVGRDCLVSNDSGAANVAIGFSSMSSNYTGIGNTAVGYGSAGSSNTNYNTAIGYIAGSNATSGQYNTALGAQADVSSLTAFYRTSLGADSICLSNNTIRCGRASTDTLRGYNYTADSDRRLKENIQDLSLGLDFIMTLRPVSYKWKDRTFPEVIKDGKVIKPAQTITYNRNHAGFIAQEIGSALISAGVDCGLYQDAGVANGITQELPVDMNNYKDPIDLKGYSVEQMLAIAVKAIQELKNEINELKNKA